MKNSPHRFHIPVMGLGYTIDTPIKVAKYGIDSVISIIQDDLIEKARAYYCQQFQVPYEPITKDQPEYRNRRITAYLNLVNEWVDRSFNELISTKAGLEKYASLLPGNRTAEWLLDHPDQLRKGSIDVNIMTKLDRQPNGDATALTEASSALKGYAESDLDSNLILSAGLNPRLFSYMQSFDDFYPDATGYIKKRIVVKVSDFRSALIQGKMLAKKGLWVSEYRIESGLNCGGHTFATEGQLMGPILEEFKQERANMLEEQLELCQEAWESTNKHSLAHPYQYVTVQGGLGESSERLLMENHYAIDATGWGSPFLLVPEATTLDEGTMNELIHAGEQDIYNSGVSPLGIRFNTIRNNSAEQVKMHKVTSGKPGSPCNLKHLALDKSGQCTASAKYQKRKIKELDEQNLSPEAYEKAFLSIVEKECICEGLASSFLKKAGFKLKQSQKGISVCPGPNLAYFNRTYSLSEMVDHIYGKKRIVEMDRPHVFIKELELYLAYFHEQWEAMQARDTPDPREEKRLENFRKNLLSGIGHYRNLMSVIDFENEQARLKFEHSLDDGVKSLESYHAIAV